MPNCLPRTRLRFMLLFVPAWLTTIGCAHAPAPMHVRYADIGKGGMKGFTGAQPLIIEFQPGERVPVNLDISGDDFVLDPPHPQLELVVKQHYFVRIDRDGFRTSPAGAGISSAQQVASSRAPSRSRRSLSPGRSSTARSAAAIAAESASSTTAERTCTRASALSHRSTIRTRKAADVARSFCSSANARR